ncbi:uncharacterized protein LOC115679546 [Syzygium oleosum]|uniref:uncharacterized protein LOC115679546 n=1 Tax=Syzygium oleosum TaxID=219896 RepID=UPI0024B975B7|nr:uncharacterized protein LOC115679546 [Syzygium oleosum]
MSLINTVLPLLKDLWADWGIHFLVSASIACEIFLTILGIRRKYMTFKLARFITWATYLLLSYIAKIALGKLTVVRINDPENPRYNVELEGLFAPVLLMQLGYPDGIMAYAVEDNRLGMRQILNIGATVVFVVRILIRCQDGSSPVSWLYIPLFIARFMKAALWVWALKSVYDENSILNAEHFPKVDTKEVREDSAQLEVFPEDKKFNSAKDILKAYFRFDCLKPHLVNWQYHPVFISHDWMSIDSYPANRAFTVNKIELNFMFDVLYTKAPILYTKRGIIARFVGFFCLVSALCRFAVIFKNTFLIDMYITTTYALLMAVTSLEFYQITTLAFTDWAVVVMGKNLGMPLFSRLVSRLLPFLADRCMRKKRWSRSMGQLSLLKHCLAYQERTKPVRLVLHWFGTCKLVRLVLDWFGKREIYSWHWLHSRQPMPSSLRALVLQKMAELEKKRDSRDFTERGKWTLEIHGVQEKQRLSRSIEAKFAKSIIIWHIATEVLQSLEIEKSDACGGSKFLSEYMMYLLAQHPHMLSLPTANITLEYACCTVMPFLRYRDYEEAMSTLSSMDGFVPLHVEPGAATRVHCGWHVLLDVHELVADLRTMGNKWELISSIWVEMLCYAVDKCPVYHHAKRLRRGGELITHLWLLLAHKTDKFPYENPEACLDFPEVSLLGKRFF